MDQSLIPIIIFIAGQTIALAIALVKIYNNSTVKSKEMEVRIISLEKRMAKVEDKDDTISHKLDGINEKLHDILVRLERKADRS